MASLVRGPNLALILVECSLVVVRLLEWAVVVMSTACIFRICSASLCSPHEHTKIAGILFSTRNLMKMLFCFVLLSCC